MGEKGKWTWQEDGMQVVRSTARTGPGCHEGCGVLLYTKDGKLVKVEGNPDFPFSQGRLCPRCLALPEVVYHPDRLKYPLKRVGERGEGKWQRITWQEALDTVADKLGNLRAEFGAESVIFCGGTQRDIGTYSGRLATAFGSPHRLSFGPLLGHACYMPRVGTSMITMGGFAVADCSQYFTDRYDNPNWKAPQCIILWGNTPTAS
ncbi:molybdopterin-dependent oxidoreductase, partial [Chloroflexota bacterium]